MSTGEDDVPLPARTGTQSVERTIRIIKAVAEHGEFGWKLADLARHCGLDKSTVFRILACLVRERMVRRGARDDRYLPGPLLFELGLALPSYAEFNAAAQQRLTSLAHRTRLVASLYYRSGDDSVCAFSTGPGTTRSFIKHASRRPLLATAAGVCILIALPAREARDVLERNLASLAGRSDDDTRKLKALYLACKREQATIHEGHYVPGINGIGLPVPDSGGMPLASVVVSGTAKELPRERFAAIQVLLEAEVNALAALAAGKFDEAAAPAGVTPAARVRSYSPSSG